jgi:hypothetical protein
MIDVNTVKKSASMSRRLDGNIKRAVEMFWPENSSAMMQVLLATDIDDSYSDHSFSFTSLALGAIGVWQECWDLLQNCNRKDTGHKSYYEKQSTNLEIIKTELIDAVGQTQFELVARNVALMEVMYLTLHVRRLTTFIANPRLQRLLLQLNTMLQRQTVDSSLELTCSRVNADLKTNFSLRQRENISDFLEHLEAFFQQDVTSHLEAQKWMICGRGLFDQKCLL